MIKKMREMVNIWSLLSLLCIIIGIISWILFLTVPRFNIGIDQGFSLWLLTFIVNPIGIGLGLVAFKKEYPYSSFLIIGNTVMTLSIFPMITIVTLIWGP